MPEWLVPLRCPPQSVEVRRGRLVAHGESFVHMLGGAIEAALGALRAEHKARVAAGEIQEEESEDELDDFYPASLPPWCALGLLNLVWAAPRCAPGWQQAAHGLACAV